MGSTRTNLRLLETNVADEMSFLRPLFDRLGAHARLGARRPFVTLSYAQSVDGSIATQPSRPFALSCDRSFDMTHLLRSRHDALLVGIDTVLTDDPQLTVRRCEGSNPLPLILDSRLRFPLHARLLSHPDKQPLVLTTAAAGARDIARLEARGASVRVLPADPLGRVDLIAALQCLAELGIDSVMVEGGATVINGFLRSRLVDYCVITVVPRLIGGVKALATPCSPGDTPPLSIVDCRYQQLGGDLIVHGTIGQA
ncbi:MAG TPA: RibD family protein [Burkholderiaceae bacterium]|nr:RibD family protein [Burkholderiaceae bacterium]